MPSESKLSIVGIGPGNHSKMTFQATRAISDAKFVVGYRPYLELIGDLLTGKEVVSSNMGREVERSKTAVELLDKGSVALISSGDPNIYGMAGLGLEVASSRINLDLVEVVPGVTSFTAAACRAGIIFRDSIAVISLSDLLTPWSSIETRLKLAAEIGMPVALYNPKSMKRNWQLKKTLEIFGEDSEVLIAKNLDRKGEEIRWARARQLLEEEERGDKIDMFTLVILFVRGISRGTTSELSGINIVGIGPGDPSQLTLEAKELLKSSARIFGPERYLQVIRGISRGLEISHRGTCSQRMAQRFAESKMAWERGEQSSILTGGDPSIFSSAWRVLAEAKGVCNVHVSPGISAFSAMAAKVGAPLINDFVLLSEAGLPSRISRLANADFGIVVYNVRGQEIQPTLQEIDPNRPCALARDVARDGEEIVTSTVGDLMEVKANGLRFTLMIASANSYIKDGRIITKRGYEARYTY